jgi:hypothetical protein
MKKLLLAALAVGTAITTAMPAEARQGCVPNRVRRVVVVPAPRVGVYYPGRGYWHANRYWGHRYRWHGGWRYR